MLSSMDIILDTQRLDLETGGEGEIVDITPELVSRVEQAGLEEGQVLIFCPGSTGGLTTVEHEPGLVRDLAELWERIAPRDQHYHHEDTWHDGNGHSHVRASLLGPSLVVPVFEGRPVLGTWQQVIFVDFDNRARQRRLVVQLSGRRGEGQLD
ncbi:MAG: secondary thiamine-phosphate synthase enzyme YjbQ [Acidobacteriota bacterium]